MESAPFVTQRVERARQEKMRLRIATRIERARSALDIRRNSLMRRTRRSITTTEGERAGPGRLLNDGLPRYWLRGESSRQSGLSPDKPATPRFADDQLRPRGRERAAACHPTGRAVLARPASASGGVTSAGNHPALASISDGARDVAIHVHVHAQHPQHHRSHHRHPLRCRPRRHCPRNHCPRCHFSLRPRHPSCLRVRRLIRHRCRPLRR